jgi:hypothetical protein
MIFMRGAAQKKRAQPAWSRAPRQARLYERANSVRPALPAIGSQVKPGGTGTPPTIAAPLPARTAAAPRSAMGVRPAAAVDLNDRRIRFLDGRDEQSRLRGHCKPQRHYDSKDRFHRHNDPLSKLTMTINLAKTSPAGPIRRAMLAEDFQCCDSADGGRRRASWAEFSTTCFATDALLAALCPIPG